MPLFMCKMPQGFPQEGKVLKLKRSLYSLKQSPLHFFKRLRGALDKAGLKPSSNDPCLFSGEKVICVSYVDDYLFWSKDEKYTQQTLDHLQDKNNPDRLQINIKDDVAGFLGILMQKNNDGLIKLLQVGLVDQIL